MCAQIRKVLSEDRDQILEISRHIWEGHDYLPFVFDEWLKDPACSTHGVVIKDRVVAVANLRIIENGRTGWMEGLRVHPDFRRKGFADALTEHVVRMGGQLGVQRLRYTTSTENEASLKLAEKYGFSKILEMSVSRHPNPIMSPPPQKIYVRESDPQEVYRLLKGNPSIIPHRILIYDWKARDANLENFKTLGAFHSFYVASRTQGPNSLSLGYLRKRPEQPRWTFTIFAADEEGFLAHLYHNISIALQQGKTPIMGTHDIIFEKNLQSLGWATDEFWGTRLVLLERSLGGERPSSIERF